MRMKAHQMMTRYGELVNGPLEEGRYQDALRRMKESVEHGAPLEMEDGPGMVVKCSWGMCSTSKSQWPDKDDDTFPDQHETADHVSRRPMQGDQQCALDRGVNQHNHGCYHRCRMFKPGPEGAPSREEVVELYSIRIRQRVEAYGQKVTADDGE